MTAAVVSNGCSCCFLSLRSISGLLLCPSTFYNPIPIKYHLPVLSFAGNSIDDG